MTVSLAGLSGSTGYVWLNSIPRPGDGLGQPTGCTGVLKAGRKCGKEWQVGRISSDVAEMQRKGLDNSVLSFSRGSQGL